MLFAELVPLCERLRQLGRHLTIETAGTRYLPLACDLMSISPKLSNSRPNGSISPRWRQRHEQTRQASQVIRRLVAEYACQFKFVVGSIHDAEESITYLASFPEIDRACAMLMPLGTDPQELSQQAQWMEPFCRRHGLRFCPRRQIEWFGAIRGT
jgi:7-carboxy-7-deazaguanine synthase